MWGHLALAEIVKICACMLKQLGCWADAGHFTPGPTKQLSSHLPEDQIEGHKNQTVKSLLSGKGEIHNISDSSRSLSMCIVVGVVERLPHSSSETGAWVQQSSLVSAGNWP